MAEIVQVITPYCRYPYKRKCFVLPPVNRREEIRGKVVKYGLESQNKACFGEFWVFGFTLQIGHFRNWGFLVSIAGFGSVGKSQADFGLTECSFTACL